MPTIFHLGYAALLVACLLGLVLGRGGPARWPGRLYQLTLVAALCAWTGGTLASIAADRSPGLEVHGYALRPPVDRDAVTLGTDPAADVRLFDGHAARIHALVRWEAGGEGDPVPSLWNASADHQLELDGLPLHHAALLPGTTLSLGGRELEVIAGGLWPGVTFAEPGGPVRRLRAGPVRGLLALLPLLGPRVHTTLAWLQPRPDEGFALLDAPPLPGTGPVARIETRGRAAILTFVTANDRATHPVIVDPPGLGPARPGDRPVPLRGGEVITVGYSRFRVGVERGGVVTLGALGSPARMPWPAEARIIDPAGVLLRGDEEGERLILARLAPGAGFASFGGRTVLADGGPGRRTLSAGDRLELPVGPGATASLRVAARPTPVASLRHLASSTDGATWAALGGLALLYLLVTALATGLGYVHTRTAGVLHGAALLFAVGLICLFRLADPADTLRAGWALRQARLGLGAMAAAALGLAALWVWAGVRRRAGLKALRGGALLRWLDGPRDDGSRARWLYGLAVAVLLVQLPFGETGIALPGIGSIQPIELSRTLLVIYLAYWTSRAVEAKRAHLREPEGLSARWRYLAHGAPVLVVLALCYGLHDISPILVFAVFLAVLYGVSLVRPSLRLWPPRAWRDHLAVDALIVVAIVAGVGFVLLGDPDGTVARRIQVWWDPWSRSAEAYQAVTALWAAASGGLWGLGWEGANGVLPPAVRDDFILALLAARGGAAAVALVAANFGVIALAGVFASSSGAAPGEQERASLLSAAMLWMLLIQAAVVLGSATGGLPVMGQPLPFVAAAGSHLVLFCMPAVCTVLVCTRAPQRSEARAPRRAPLAPRVRRPLSVPAPEPRAALHGIPMGPLSLSPPTELFAGPMTDGAGR